MRFLVYLAGPITGLNYDGATDWRENARRYLLENSGGLIESLSPMRSKPDLMNETSIEDTYEDNIMETQRGIFGRDRFDCMRADLVLVNFLGATRVSIGTSMEVAWADANKTPIVMAMEDGNLHDHAMIREAAQWRTPDLSEALDTVVRILCP